MFTSWTKGLDEGAKEQFILNVRAAQPAIRRILEVAQEHLEVSENLSKSRDVYDKASWPYFQADLLGEQRAYNKLIKLIENLKTEG